MPRINELPPEATPAWDDEIPFCDKPEKLTNKMTVEALMSAFAASLQDPNSAAYQAITMLLQEQDYLQASIPEED